MTRRICLGIFLALAEVASAWEGWHPSAWTNWRGSVETVAVYATAHSTTLTNWTSTTTSTTFVESWLANITFYTNRLGDTSGNAGIRYVNLWTWTLRGPTSEVAWSITTTNTPVLTNLVVTSRDIMALDTTLALQERQYALRFPRGSAPRFLRDNRACLMEAKATLMTSMVTVVHWNTNLHYWAVEDVRDHAMSGHWVDHLGLTTAGFISSMSSNVYLQSQERFTQADSDEQVGPSSYSAEILHPGPTSNTYWQSTYFPSMVLTQLTSYAAVPSNYNAYTPWRSLNGLGYSEGRVVTTTWVCTWGTATQAVTDYHGGSHDLSGTNGQIFAIASTSQYVMAGWREGDYGWQGIRREITNLWLATSKTLSDGGVDGTWVNWLGDIVYDPGFATLDAMSNAFTNVWFNGGSESATGYDPDPYAEGPMVIYNATAEISIGSVLPASILWDQRLLYPSGGGADRGYVASGWSIVHNFAYDSGDATNIEHVAHLLMGATQDGFTQPDYADFPQIGVIASNGSFGEYAAWTNYVASPTGQVLIGYQDLRMPAWPTEIPTNGGPAKCRGWRVDWAGWLIDWTATTNGLKYR